MSVLGRRLKQARMEAGLSQEQLGIEAGLDPMSASTRMNRYELGRRVPNFELVVAIAKILGVPAAYFYSVRDDEAELLKHFQKLPVEQRRKLLQSMRVHQAGDC